MKKLLSVCLFAALATAVHAGPLTANLMAPTTNIVAYNNTTLQISTIPAAAAPPAASTNYFNLNIGSVTGAGYSINTTTSNAVISTSSVQSGGFIVSGAQVNTNQLPVYAINTFPGYPGSLYGPAQTLGIYVQVWLQGANPTTNRTVQLNWYQSPDGVNITGVGTNYTGGTGLPVPPAFSQFVTIPAGQNQGSCYSNFPVASQSYFLLGQFVNTNMTAFTNVTIEASQKPGF